MFFYKLKVESKIYLFIFNLKKSMKKIIMSLAMIAAVGAIVVGATRAYFSDTETSTGNTFTAGTIDIAIDGENPWIESYDIGDLKPCETGYINFDITNVGMNPVNVSKRLFDFESKDIAPEGYNCDNLGFTSSEPECVREKEIGTIVNDVQTQIIYDLYVEVYDANNMKIWWQEIFNKDENKKLADIYYGQSSVFLGMIPVNGHMKVTQSYHFDCKAGNEYQGDGMTFSMEIYGKQLTGENGMAYVDLENKRIGDPEWDIIQDDIKGTLGYKTSGPLFDYTFSGVAPLIDHEYVLAVGYDANTDVDTKVGEGTTNESGEISFNGTFDTGILNNAKVWLVPAENWDYANDKMNWAGWDVSEFLWEVGLINYVKN